MSHLKNNKIVVMVALVLLFSLVLVSCTSAGAPSTAEPAAEVEEEPAAEPEEAEVEEPAEEPEEAEPLIVNMSVAPGTLDPAWAVDGAEFIQNFYVRLTQYPIVEKEDGTFKTDPTLPMEPYFAESWDISEDGTEYTFHLAEGAVFPSGEPVNAEAVKYSIDRITGMDTVGAYYIIDGIYDPYLIQSVEAVDENTVVIQLSIPNPNFLEDLTMPAGSILDPSVVEANGGWEAYEVNEYVASHAFGSGPYLLEEYEPNVKAVLVANPDYFGDPPGAEKIIVNFINQDETLLLQARSGAADVTIGLSPQSVASLEDDPNVKITANETTYAHRFGLANTKPPLDNVKFREALSYAVPYEAIIENVAFGYGDLYYGPFPPTMGEYNPEIGAPREYDIEKAKALIEESGVETPADVEVVFQEGNTTHEQILTILQGEFSKIGVNLILKQLAAVDFTNAVEGHEAQAHMRYDGTGVYDAGYFMGFDMVCALMDSYNVNEICIPGADDIIWEARQELDPEVRQEKWDEIQQMWVDNSPFIPVYLDVNTTVLAEDVKEFVWSHLQELRYISK